MKNRQALTLFTLLVAVLLATTPALAKKPDHAGGGEKHHKTEKVEKHEQAEKRSEIGFLFGEDKRSAVRAFLGESYRRNCPPGLAKKHNGCLPPGQAKKYAIGGILPHGHTPITTDLLNLLGPAPSGTFYAMIDKDVVLAAEGTKKILDAITLFSAME